jgi:hypothetical protein
MSQKLEERPGAVNDPTTKRTVRKGNILIMLLPLFIIAIAVLALLIIMWLGI